jgi:hypothetical protein
VDADCSAGEDGIRVMDNNCARAFFRRIHHVDICNSRDPDAVVEVIDCTSGAVYSQVAPADIELWRALSTANEPIENGTGFLPIRLNGWGVWVEITPPKTPVSATPLAFTSVKSSLKETQKRIRTRHVKN